MKRIGLAALACACALVLVLAAGCGSDDEKKSGGEQKAGSALPQGSDAVELNAEDFTRQVDNPYWPMAPDGAPGRRWVYRSSEERIVVTVTSRRKQVAGIDALVVRDVATDTDGELVEVTDDWYAQDSAGNVWYLGEDTKEYEKGKVVSTKGSWEHGVDGAYAGIIMPAKPRVGLAYRQEYYEGEAEDLAKVIGLDESVKVPFGSFDSTVATEDTTPLEPDVVEHKYYARDIGPVLKKPVAGGGHREALVSFRR